MGRGSRRAGWVSDEGGGYGGGCAVDVDGGGGVFDDFGGVVDDFGGAGDDFGAGVAVSWSSAVLACVS